MTKIELRHVLRLRRATCDPALGVRLAGHILASGLIGPADVVGGYWPLAGEIDSRAALLALYGRGLAVGLPVTPPIGEPLSFRRWRPGAALQPGPFGTAEPGGEALSPTVLLVPLLGFDRSGGRIGYGGGYYDRTLAQLGPGVMAIGCGFMIQEVDRIPTEPHDRAMNAVATEAGVIIAG